MVALSGMRILAKHVLSTLAGALASVAIALVITWGTAATVGSYKHPLEAWPWLFQVSVVPCTLGALVFSLISARAKKDRVLFHLAAAVVAFFAVAFAGSIGAVAVAHAHGKNPNISGYFGWCWIYAAVLLPVTYPVAVVLELAVRQLHQMLETDESP